MKFLQYKRFENKREADFYSYHIYVCMYVYAYIFMRERIQKEPIQIGSILAITLSSECAILFKHRLLKFVLFFISAHTC